MEWWRGAYSRKYAAWDVWNAEGAYEEPRPRGDTCFADRTWAYMYFPYVPPKRRIVINFWR